MKFKQSEGQNQRIERITTSHLIIGTDMAKASYELSRACPHESTPLI